MKFLTYIPLFGILLIAYNSVMLVSDAFETHATLMQIPLISRDEPLKISIGDLIIMLGVIFLYVELFKATRTTASSIADHAASMIVFVIFLIEFITVGRAGTAVFLILTLMSALDVVAGFTITIAAARRDFGIGGQGLSGD